MVCRAPLAGVICTVALAVQSRQGVAVPARLAGNEAPSRRRWGRKGVCAPTQVHAVTFPDSVHVMAWVSSDAVGFVCVLRRTRQRPTPVQRLLPRS